MTATPPDDPLSLPLADFTRGTTITTTSAFVAAQQAALGFAQLPDSASRTFIYTGNILNTISLPSILGLGVGKSGAAHIIQSAAAAYKDRGYKYSTLPRLYQHTLIGIGSTTAMSGRWMVRQHLKSTGKRMQSSTWNSLKGRHRERGSRHLSKV